MNGRRGTTFSKGKAKNAKYTLKRLWNYLYQFRVLLIISFILTVLSNVLALLGPSITGKIMNEIAAGKSNINFKNIYYYAVLLLIFYLLSNIISLMISFIMIRISKKCVYTMRKDAFNKMMKLPISYFDTNQIGDIISRFSYDIDTVNTSLSTDLIQILTSFITIVGSLVMMIIISPLLVLVFVITLPISLLFTRVMIKKTSKYFKARSHNLGLLSGFNEEMITGSKTIKAYGKEQEIIEKFNKFNNDAANASYMAEYYSAYTGPGVNFVNNLSLSLICLFGAILSKKQMLLLGDISSFVLYSKKFSGPINEIANIVTDLQSALAAAERVFELIDEKEELKDEPNAISLNVEEGNVSFKNVYFGYNSNKLILKDISFDALAGKQIAIVGPTGSGKTTIVNLLMRFYDIKSGSIYLDDNNIQMIKRKDLRLSYAMVLQDTWLFEGTVYENLIYGNDNVTLDDVKTATKAARIDTFIESLPNGYDTILSEGGTNISKGQKQLLTIARAMLLDAKMLILDEATSNVDTRTEIKIQEAMKNLMKDKTSFIIAHRLSTIKNADIILVIKDGELVEQGNHDELLNRNGFYKELYISQFNN